MLRQVLTAALLGTVMTAGAAAGPPPARALEMAETLCPVLQTGDLVFKGAQTGLWTELAAEWSEGDRRWGHVGVVVVSPRCRDGVVNRTPRDAIIVHADTGAEPEHPADGNGTDSVGEVRAVPLAEFLGRADHAGVFRLKLSPGARASLAAWAGEKASARTPFDRGYSLDSENNLYCTELVWRAISAALGRDAIPEKSTRLGRTYVALSDLSLHPLAEEIMELDWRE